MVDISGIAVGAGMPNVGGAGKQLQQTESGGGFSQVMNEPDPKGAQQTAAPDPPEAAPAADKERLRAELAESYKHVPAADGPMDVRRLRELFPELLATAQTRMGMMREAVSGVGRTPKVADLRGRLSQVENEWNSLEAMWRSDKELTPSELLGLQARLYQVSQHVEVLSKVVDQVTGGIKTVLNTNV